MPVSERELKYPKTIELIYSECAKRLKKRKLALKLTDSEIAGDFDRKIISRIINNRRTRNNPYLIPPAYVKPLVDKLKLNSDYELFWADSKDEKFIETMFCHLLTDMLDEHGWLEDSNADIVENVLIDDVSYAKIQPTVMSSFEYKNADGDYLPISPINYVNDDEQVSFTERERIRQHAIQRFFKNTQPIEMFKQFFQETNNNGENKGFRKLDTRLDNFIRKNMVPFLNSNMPGKKSLGLRVFSIVSTDLMNYVELEFINADRIAKGYDSYESPEQNEILHSLMEAGKDYINIIEGLQARLDELHRKERFGR